jgi:hypothetical protein
MRKVVLLSLVAWLGLGVATAFADVTVLATIDKTKDIGVIESIIISKDIAIDVIVNAEAVNKAAEAEALINQSHDGFNRIEVEDATRRDTLNNSANDNSSVLTINQAAGNMNNQGSAISVALVGNGGEPTFGPPGFAGARAAADQRNTTTDTEGSPLTDSASTEAQITGSITDNVGIVHVNQTPGTANNQANNLAVAVSLSGGVALGESHLGQVNAGNTVSSLLDGQTNEPVSVTKTALAIGSVNDNTGIVGVNQAAGNRANQINSVGIGVSLTSPALGLPIQ